MALTTRVLKENEAGNLLETLWRLDILDDVNDLTDYFRSGILPSSGAI